MRANRIARIDSLVHPGNNHRGIPRVLTRRKYGVPEPGPPGKALRREQIAFHCPQRGIQRSGVPFRRELFGHDRHGLARKPAGRPQRSIKVHAHHACILGARLRAEQVSLYLPGIGDVVVGQHIGIRHVQHLQAENPRHLLLINEGRVRIHHEPGVVVEDRVINPVRAGGTDIRRRHPQVLNERCVIRTAAQISDADLTTDQRNRRRIVKLFARVPPRGSIIQILFPFVVDRTTFRAGHLHGDLTNELLE